MINTVEDGVKHYKEALRLRKEAQGRVLGKELYPFSPQPSGPSDELLEGMARALGLSDEERRRIEAECLETARV